MAPFAQKRMLAHWKPDAKHPGGRPSEYDPVYAEMVTGAMAAGLSLTAFAGQIGKSKDQVYRWMTAHSEFSNAVARGQAARTLAWELNLMSARSGGQAQVAMFALKNVAPHEWRDIKYQQHEHQHQLTVLTDAQLHAIAAGSAADVGDGVTIDHEPQQPNER